MRRITLLCASAGLLIGGCQTNPPTPPDPAFAVPPLQESYFPSDVELTELLQTMVEQGEAKGIVLGLIEPDGRRRVLAFGDAGPEARPLSSKTVFEIGSINKTFTNAVLTDMVRRGEVSLDDPVAKYLPAGVTLPSRGGREITLLHLATHTSGLPRIATGYNPPDPSNPYAEYEASHLYAFLSSYKLERDVGTEPVYSNLGAGLLGHALARAAGVQTIGQLIRQRITGPLNMTMTDYGRNGEIGAWIAKGYKDGGVRASYWDAAVLAGAGGLNSNIEDMLTYLEANIGEPRNSLEAAMRDAHRARRSLKTEGFSIGLGWQQKTRGSQTIVHHGGGTGGFKSYLGFDPAGGAGVVILANSGAMQAHDAVVFQLLRGSRLVALPETTLANYAGSYQLRPELLLTVSHEGGKLFGQIGKQKKARMYAVGPENFILLTTDMELRFTAGQSGSITSATITKGGQMLTGPKLAG